MLLHLNKHTETIVTSTCQEKFTIFVTKKHMSTNNETVKLKLEAKVRSFLVENREVLKLSAIDSILFGDTAVISKTSRAMSKEELVKVSKFLSTLPRFSSSHLTLDTLSELSSISEKEKEFSQKRKRVVKLSRPDTPELDGSVRGFLLENKNVVVIAGVGRVLGFEKQKIVNFQNKRTSLSASEMLALIEFLSNFPRLEVDESELKLVAKLTTK